MILIKNIFFIALNFAVNLAVSLIASTTQSYANDSPGGTSSSNDWSKQSFNHPLSNSTSLEKQYFGVGNKFFKQPWVEFPSSTVGRDGLGPTFNAVACAACHVNDGRGIGFINDKVNLSILFRLAQSTTEGLIPHPDYGSQLQPLALNGVIGEANANVVFQYITGTYPDGSTYELRKPIFNFTDFKNSAFDNQTQISARVAPHIIGLGLIEAIDPNEILKIADPLDSDQDGISGRGNFVFDIETQKLSLGRFGWKASQPTLKQQNAAAFIGDMGLTSFLFPEQNCPLVQLDCLNALFEIPYEVEDRVLDRVTLYTQLIAVPKSRNSKELDFIEGKQIFSDIGCVKCHQDNYSTARVHSIEALRDQKISPYSDFLLHDMGPDLADGVVEGLAEGYEWRTPPLWSLGLIQTVNRHSNLLHDNRARNFEEAILWHGGEALTIKNNFMNLQKSKREQLLYFIESI